MKNDTCVKSSMEPQAYKVVSTNAHEISGWNILSRLLHSRTPHLGVMNGDVQSDIATLAFKNGEKIEDFHRRILRLRQEIMHSGEIFSPIRLLFPYMKALKKSEKLRSFIAPKMTDLLTFFDNNGKYAVYTGVDIHGIYPYLEMIGSPTTLTTSGQSSHHFVHSSSRNNDAATLQTVIVALRTRQKIICEYCGRIGHKADACIIRGPKFLPPSIRIKMNQFNALHGDEPKEPPREWNRQPPEAHFKSRSSPSRTNPVVSAIMGKLNHHAIDNGDITSDVPVYSNYYSVPDPDNTPIKSIYDD